MFNNQLFHLPVWQEVLAKNKSEFESTIELNSKQHAEEVKKLVEEHQDAKQVSKMAV